MLFNLDATYQNTLPNRGTASQYVHFLHQHYILDYAIGAGFLPTMDTKGSSTYYVDKLIFHVETMISTPIIEPSWRSKNILLT